jgi:hypothetical protein
MQDVVAAELSATPSDDEHVQAQIAPLKASFFFSGVLQPPASWQSAAIWWQCNAIAQCAEQRH